MGIQMRRNLLWLHVDEAGRPLRPYSVVARGLARMRPDHWRIVWCLQPVVRPSAA
jgi:hypothetical protein